MERESCYHSDFLMRDIRLLHLDLEKTSIKTGPHPKTTNGYLGQLMTSIFP